MRVLSAATAIAIGLLILLGYFLPLPLLAALRLELVHWAVIVAGAAALVGVFNLIRVHWQKIRRRQKGAIYSALLIASLFAAFLLGLALGPASPLMRGMVEGVILPVEAGLMALLAVTLVYAAIRLLRRRADLMTVVFLATALIALLAAAPLIFGPIPGLSDWIAPWIARVPAAAGARGLLLGVALGTLTTGLRVLFGADRPYGGK